MEVRSVVLKAVYLVLFLVECWVDSSVGKSESEMEKNSFVM